MGQPVNETPLWKSYLYHLQQQSPKPKKIICQSEIKNSPIHYDKGFHGSINRDNADFQLTIGGEGSYLIRESLRAPGQYTLAIRFEGKTKNFKLYFDGQHYVGEKKFDTIEDLVEDGLITFHLQSKAADYIAAQTNVDYAKSPYAQALQGQQQGHHLRNGAPQSASSQRRRQQQQHKRNSSIITEASSVMAGDVARHRRIAASHDRKEIKTESTVTETAANKDEPSNGIAKVEATTDRPIPSKRKSLIQLPTKDQVDSLEVEYMNTHEVNEAGLGSVSYCNDFLQVMGSAKFHDFKTQTFIGPHWCDFCANFLWGLISQGVKCQDCGFNAHKKCSEKVPNDCIPDMKYLRRTFGVELTILVKAENTLVPSVVRLCINEIELRGLDSEGLYRVAGFHDDMITIRESFDKDPEHIDISSRRYEDINTIASVLKLYFRSLPVALVSNLVNEQLQQIIVINKTSTSEKKMTKLRRLLSKHLQPSYLHTLKFVLQHLERVSRRSKDNRMTVDNLAIVFSPTLGHDMDIYCLEYLIHHHQRIFD